MAQDSTQRPASSAWVRNDSPGPCLEFRLLPCGFRPTPGSSPPRLLPFPPHHGSHFLFWTFRLQGESQLDLALQVSAV